MTVPVAVGLSRRVARIMFVLMMFVVDVRVRVFHLLVHMHMLMAFREMQPNARRHARGADHERRRWLLAPHD